jgi:hypothetical protein
LAINDYFLVVNRNNMGGCDCVKESDTCAKCMHLVDAKVATPENKSDTAVSKPAVLQPKCDSNTTQTSAGMPAIHTPATLTVKKEIPKVREKNKYWFVLTLVCL